MMIALCSDMAHTIQSTVIYVITLGVSCNVTRGAAGMLVQCATGMCIKGMLDAAGEVALV